MSKQELENENLKSNTKIDTNKNWLYGWIYKMSKFEKIFWVATLVLLAVYIILIIVPLIPHKPIQPKEPFTPYEFPDYNDEIAKNLEEKKQIMHNKITKEADDLFSVDRVDDFLDFHYSVTGEYTELIVGTLGEIQEMVAEKLFNNFDKTQEDALSQMYEKFKTVANEHSKFISNVMLDGVDATLNIKALIRLNNDIEFNNQIHFTKITGLVTMITGSRIIASMVIRFAARTALKIAARGGITAASASVGILCGPYVVVCATVLATITWFTSDYVIIKLDEFWHREEFKQEIIGAINNSKQSFIKQYSDAYDNSLNEYSDKVQKLHENAGLINKKIL